jgi:hypothetical protein
MVTKAIQRNKKANITKEYEPAHHDAMLSCIVGFQPDRSYANLSVSEVLLNNFAIEGVEVFNCNGDIVLFALKGNYPYNNISVRIIA